MKTKTVETEVDLHAVAAATALSEIPDDAVRGVTTGDALEAFVRSQRASKLRVGDILKEMGLVTDEQITSALVRQKETHQRIGQILIESGVLSELDLTRALAAKFGVHFPRSHRHGPRPGRRGGNRREARPAVRRRPRPLP